MATYTTKTVDGKVVQIEERTYRIEVRTPKTEAGIAGYSAVAYRERIETTDGVVTKLVQLPPLRIPLSSRLTSVMSLITGSVDAQAMQSIAQGTWPLDNEGRLIPV